MKMGYRADGLRAWVVASSSTSGGVTAETEKVYNYYDGGNAVLEKGEDGSILSTNVFAPDGLVARSYNPPAITPEGEGNELIDILIGFSYVGEYMFDWQGNATHILSPTAVQEWGQPTNYDLIHSAYNAWGQKRFLYPANTNMELHRFGYNARWGYRTDTETGLVYCQNRYYDPANGRWVTRDPIGYAGGVNLYGYCGSGPVGAADPWGLEERKLTKAEEGELQTAADFLKNNGERAAAIEIRHLYRTGRVLIDTELGADAEWRNGVLYLNPSLFAWKKFEGMQGRNRELALEQAFRGKVWLASVFLHEMDHFENSEQSFNYAWNIPSAERRAWMRQIRFLQKLLANSSGGRKQLLEDMIKDAIERWSSY